MTSKRALETSADGVSITARDEAAARIKDILECSAADADLQHPAVKATFKIEVVTESQLG
jgi:bifunctional ADP-heptose synthase (sugar kinase/adenylyltransferase)